MVYGGDDTMKKDGLKGIHFPTIFLFDDNWRTLKRRDRRFPFSVFLLWAIQTYKYLVISRCM